jgi:hypothetical protein
MLIGQKTTPKGCRVKNISQQGMLLQCEPDGRLLTFSKGDKVDIHLTVQYAGEKKSLTIPSRVRHVNEAYIYVEFQHPDLKLVELIESYLASEAYELEASVGHEDVGPTVARVTAITDTAPAPQKTPQNMQDQKGKHRLFYYGLLTLILAICIITGGYLYTASVDGRLGMLEDITERQTAELAAMREQVFSSTLQEGRYASLNARMTALTDAFGSLENKLTQLISQRFAGTPASSNDSHILITSLTGPGTAPPKDKASEPAVSAEQEDTLTAELEAYFRGSTQPAAAQSADKAPEPAGSAEQEDTLTAELEAYFRGSTQPPAAQSADKAPEPAGSAEQEAAELDANFRSTVQPAAEEAAMGETAILQPVVTSADPAAQPAAEIGTATTEEPAIETTASQVPATSLEPQVVAPPKVATPDKQGPWVINLMSSTARGYVEQHAARAHSRNVAVEVNSAEVKGRTYWRMQITGFSSARAARAEAAAVKEKLGITDVWIFRE